MSRHAIACRLHMGCLGFRALPPEEELTAQQRVISRAANTAGRLRGRYELELENRLQPALNTAIRKNASASRQKTLAQRIVQQQRHIQLLYASESHMLELAQTIRGLSSRAQIVIIMGQTTKSLQRLNRRMSMPEVAQMVQAFELEAQRLGFNSDVLNDIVAAQTDTELDSDEDYGDMETAVQTVIEDATALLMDTMPSVRQASRAHGNTPARTENLNNDT